MSTERVATRQRETRLLNPWHALERWQTDIRGILSARVLESQLGFRKTWYLGALTLGAFTIQISTGLLLMLYYHPSIPQGYADMKDLEFVISSGTLLRSLHRWSAHAMVFLVFVHMAKAFYRAAYRPPKELNWVLGVCLLLLTLLLSYTGYLLPWDQLSYWGTTVGANIMSSIPWFGPKLRFYMLGGHTVNANALLRFYVLHTMILPLSMLTLVSVHLWRLHKDGGMYEVDEEGRPLLHAKDARASGEEGIALGKEKTLSYSDLLFREVTAIEALAVVLLTIALIWKAPLEQLANPMHTPNPAKAPWYFTGLQELLHYFPPFVAGIILPGMIVSGLIFIPFLPIFDNVKTYQAIEWFRGKRARWTTGAVLILVMSVLLVRQHAWDAVAPFWIVVLLTSFAAGYRVGPINGFRKWLREKPVSFWIMTLFLMEAVVLTAVGTLFRGPGWSWVWPWRG
ncbi:MAG TPA: cytochrome b N-terminal domain-containing protein [Candidatus Acidoferrum sp.]|nr:cytochrome b N-terminal domain-containing protein [Candidatus Acidoferrum sp.]